MNARTCLAVLAVLTLTFPSSVRADGMVFRTPHPDTATVRAVEAGTQRGLVWRLRDALEVWIEPVYAWQGDDVGAWVIPLPALPQVLEGDPKVLDDLQALTDPTFLSVCWEPDCHEECGLFGCVLGGDSGSSGGFGEGTGQVEDAQTAVTVWSSGSVGPLDYQVISAASSSDVSAWLASNGYALADGAAGALATLTAEGLYFFVARVTAPAQPQQSLAPVRFRFEGDVAPFYPVRLTAAALEAGAHLDVTLWLLADQRLLPAGDPYAFADQGFPADGLRSPATYSTGLDGLLADFAQGGFAIEYVGALAESRGYASYRGQAGVDPIECTYDDLYDRVEGCVDAWGQALCEFECGHLDPISLASNLKARGREAETPFAVRVRGRLPAGTRAAEWSFEGGTVATLATPSFTGVYVDDRGDCYECPPAAGLFCGPADPGPTPAGPALLALAATLAALAAAAGWRRLRRPAR